MTIFDVAQIKGDPLMVTFKIFDNSMKIRSTDSLSPARGEYEQDR
jgi:hypothetical protein